MDCMVLELERCLAATPEDLPLCEACREKPEELWALEDHQTRGAFVRSRICLLWDMDDVSHFFYTLEKRRGANKHVTCFLSEDSTPLTDPMEIVLWEELPTVSMGNRDQLELPLTLTEFLEAHRRMLTNKSLGMDGLTVEFYRMFWDVLGPDLVTV
ncbi:unnamed protein product [Caretta caretta]